MFVSGTGSFLSAGADGESLLEERFFFAHDADGLCARFAAFVRKTLGGIPHHLFCFRLPVDSVMIVMRLPESDAKDVPCS